MPYSGVEASEGLAGSWDATINLVIEVGWQSWQTDRQTDLTGRQTFFRQTETPGKKRVAEDWLRPEKESCLDLKAVLMLTLKPNDLAGSSWWHWNADTKTERERERSTVREVEKEKFLKGREEKEHYESECINAIEKETWWTAGKVVKWSLLLVQRHAVSGFLTCTIVFLV